MSLRRRGYRRNVHRAPYCTKRHRAEPIPSNPYTTGPNPPATVKAQINGFGPSGRRTFKGSQGKPDMKSKSITRTSRPLVLSLFPGPRSKRAECAFDRLQGADGGREPAMRADGSGRGRQTGRCGGNARKSAGLLFSRQAGRRGGEIRQAHSRNNRHHANREI